MLLKLAWRNVWRNKRRTTISLAALSFGVMAIVSLHSLREGANEAMIRGLTEGLVGHAQVHGRGYQESPEIDNLVRNPRGVEARLVAAVPGADAELRVTGGGLGGSAEAATGVMVIGIEPDNPRAQALVTIEQGRGLASAPALEAVVGSGLAEDLDLGPGDELVLLGQAADGSLANDLFTVVGTADAGSFEASASTVFLHLADAQSFFSLGDGVHEVVVRLPTEEEDLSPYVALMRAALDTDALEVLPWTAMLPELKSAMDAKRKNSRLIDVIVFLIVALGIFNTMTMATFERTREFGVLASLGTRPRRILAMVTLETLLQGLIGFLVGLTLACSLLCGIGTADLSSVFGDMDILGAQLPASLTLSVHGSAVLSAGITTLLTVLAGGLAPAIRTSRLQPVEATRYV